MSAAWHVHDDREDVADAIPPQYCEHVGGQLIDHLAADREAVAR